MIKYLKAAFTKRWNLLAMIGGIGGALLSGSPDVLLPLVLAAEAAYLGVVACNPVFRRHIDTQEHKLQRSKKGERALKRILRVLPRPLVHRYQELRERCVDLQRIAADLRQSEFEDENLESDGPLETLQTDSLDRLLWIYLRLLFTYHTLQNFLQKTQRARIDNDIQRVENRLELLDSNDSSPHIDKMRRALADNLATSQLRLANYDRAAANYEFVELEIDRLENKIKSLAEVAVNRQELEYVSSQVDHVASSMLETEKTMNDMQMFTRLERLDEEIPQLLEIQTRSR